MWNLPGPGIKPVSPELAGEFLTTGPPGKSQMFNFHAFISKMTLAIVDSLHFHICFRVIFLISLKKPCWNFIEIVLNLLMCLGKIDIYTILTLPVSSVFYVQSSSVQSLSRVWLCDPMNRSTPGLPVHHQLSEFTQTHVHRVHDAIQPSHPLSSPSPPASNPSQHQSLFQWVNSLPEILCTDHSKSAT